METKLPRIDPISTKVIFSLLASLLISSASTIAFSQVLKSGMSAFNCSSDYRTEFIKKGTRESIFSDEGRERIWVQLTNTSNKEMIIDSMPTSDSYAFFKGADKVVDLYYDLVRKDGCTSRDEPDEDLPVNYSRSSITLQLILPPGKSMVFTVPAGFAKPGRAFFIRYHLRQRSKREPTSSTIKAYFFAQQVPR
jgi:hypothetical protein